MDDSSATPRRKAPSDRWVIAVHRDEIESFGGLEAIVLQQIRFYCGDPEREGWFSATATYLSEVTGLRVSQVRRVTKSLVDQGALEAVKRMAHRGDQTISYRPVEPLDSAVSRFANSGVREIENSSFREIVNSTSLPEEEEKYPCSPQGDGDGQQSLLDEPSPKPPKASKPRSGKKARNAAGVLSETQRAMFEQWWSSYPRKRAKAGAIKAWAGAIEAGVPVADLQTALKHYVESVEGWERKHGTRLEFVFAGARFIDEGYMDFLDGPDPDRWGPPKPEEDPNPEYEPW